MSTRTYRVAGKVYLVPLAAAEEFDDFLKKCYWPLFPKHFSVDDDKTKTTRKVHISNGFRGLSFSGQMAYWAAEKWKDYEQKA